MVYLPPQGFGPEAKTRGGIIVVRAYMDYIYNQGRNEVYGIRDQRPVKGWDQGSQLGIWDHSTWDRDQQRFPWNQGSGCPR